MPIYLHILISNVDLFLLVYPSVFNTAFLSKQWKIVSLVTFCRQRQPLSIVNSYHVLRTALAKSHDQLEPIVKSAWANISY